MRLAEPAREKARSRRAGTSKAWATWIHDEQHGQGVLDRAHVVEAWPVSWRKNHTKADHRRQGQHGLDPRQRSSPRPVGEDHARHHEDDRRHGHGPRQLALGPAGGDAGDHGAGARHAAG